MRRWWSFEGMICVFEPKFNGQLSSPGLLRHPRIGTAFDHETVAATSFDNAAQAIGRFEQDTFDRMLGLFQGNLIGGGHSADATAHDRDADAEPRPVPSSRAFRESRRQALQALPGQVGDGGRKLRGSVQRLGTIQVHSKLLRILAKSDIHVIQNLHVVAQETDRLQHHRLAPPPCNAVSVSSTVGPIHGPPDIPWL